MAAQPNHNPKEMSLSELFPSLAESELDEIRETLDAYCELLLRIFQRLERERRQGFDDASRDS